MAYLRDALKSVISGLPINPADRKTIAVVLTWREQCNTAGLSVLELYDSLQGRKADLYRHHRLIASLRYFEMPFDASIQEASYQWLSQTFVPDATFDGVYFRNGNLYTDVIVEYYIVHHKSGTYFWVVLAFILTFSQLL